MVTPTDRPTDWPTGLILSNQPFRNLDNRKRQWFAKTNPKTKTKGSLINQTDHRDSLATEEIQISLLCSGGQELRRGQTLIANDVIKIQSNWFWESARTGSIKLFDLFSCLPSSFSVWLTHGISLLIRVNLVTEVTLPCPRHFLFF